MDQLAQLLESELDVAARDERADGNAGWGLHEARRNRASNAPALEEAREVDSARAGRQTDNSSAQNGVANRRLGTDVGARRSRPDRDRYPRACEIGSGCRIDAVCRGQESQQ